MTDYNVDINITFTEGKYVPNLADIWGLIRSFDAQNTITVWKCAKATPEYGHSVGTIRALWFSHDHPLPTEPSTREKMIARDDVALSLTYQGWQKQADAPVTPPYVSTMTLTGSGEMAAEVVLHWQAESSNARQTVDFYKFAANNIAEHFGLQHTISVLTPKG